MYQLGEVVAEKANVSFGCVSSYAATQNEEVIVLLPSALVRTH